MSRVPLSIVVCTYNREDLLAECIDALLDQSLPSAQFEVLIVNNNSTDGTAERVRAYTKLHDHVRLVNEPRQGHACARNRGWREAAGEFVAFIDDDCKADTGWAERILAAFRSIEPQPAAVGGAIHPRFETEPPAWFTADLETHSWGAQAGFLQPPEAPYGFSGANMAFQKAVLREVDGFSENFGLVDGQLRMGEDTELFYRIHPRHPRFWYDPVIKVQHFIPRRSMTLRCIFDRCFNTGESHVYIEQDSRRLLRSRRIYRVLRLLLIEPVRFALYRKGAWKTRCAWFLRELGYQLGGVVGAFRVRRWSGAS